MSLSCCLTELGLSVQNGGFTSVCNQSKELFKDHLNQTINLSTHTLIDAWNSPTRLEIRQALNSNIRHSNCQDCWDEEDAGRKSKRQCHNEEIGSITPFEHQPRALLLKPGNLCNLSCRHCHPATSTGWYRDYYKASLPGTENKTYHAWLGTFKETRKSFSESNDVWKIISDWTNNLVYWDLYGAEPLLIDSLYNCLRQAADSGSAQNQDIHINTNGTIWRDDFNYIFSKFKSVKIDISADGIEKQFEYLRYPALWDDFEKNLYRYLQLQKQNTNIQISITVTLSLYNVYYTNSIITYFNKLGFNCSLNILHRPEYMNMRIAPEKIKNKISQNITNKDIINLLNMPYNNNEQLFKDFFIYTQSVDQVRNQSYGDFFPEMWKILNE